MDYVFLGDGLLFCVITLEPVAIVSVVKVFSHLTVKNSDSSLQTRQIDLIVPDTHLLKFKDI